MRRTFRRDGTGHARPRGWKRSVLAASALTLTTVGAGFVVAAPAQAATQSGSASITPTSVSAGSTTDFTTRVTNLGSSFSVSQVHVLVPSSFTSPSVRSVVATENGTKSTSWSASYDSSTGKVDLSPVSGGKALDQNGYVEVVVRATAPAGDNSATWTVEGYRGGNSDKKGDSLTFASQPRVTWARTPQSISFLKPADRVFGDQPAAVSASGGASNNPVTFAVKPGSGSSCTSSGTNGTTIATTGAGHCTVVASQAGNNLYLPAPDVEHTFAIAQAAQVITFDAPPSKRFGDAAFNLAASGGGSGQPVTFAVAPNADGTAGKCTLAGSEVTLTGAGRCTITASQAGDVNYHAATSETRFFTITKAEATLAISGNNHTYDRTAKSAVVTTTPSGLSGVTVTYTKDGQAVAAPTNAGIYGVVANLNNADYEAETVTGQLVIDPKPITGSFTVQGKPYDGNTGATIAGATLDGVVANDTVTIDHTDATATFVSKDAGPRTATGSGFTLAGAQAGNYDLRDVTNEVAAEISPKEITAKITAQDKPYDGTLTATAAGVAPIDGVVGGDAVEITVSNARFDSADAGPRTVTAAVSLTGRNAGNYSLSSTKASVSANINKAEGSVSIDNLPSDAVFGGSFTPEYTKSGDGAASTASTTPAVCTVGANGSVSFAAAGTCTLVASVAVGTNHHPATGAEQTFTVGKATGSVSINNLPSNAVFGGSFTPEYTKSGDGAASSTSSSTGVCTVTNGVVNYVAAGQCTLVASVAEDTNHQAATGTEQTFTVGKATGSVSINNLPSNAVFGGSFTPEYTKSGDGAASSTSSSTGVCTVTNGVVNYVAAGQCTLVASVAEDTNHQAATGTEQTFTVGKATGSVSINNLPENAVFGGAGFTPTYTKAGDGTASTTSLTTDVCSVDPVSRQVQFNGAGTCTLQASVAEGTNHLAATGTEQSFEVGKGAGSVTISNLASNAVFGGAGFTPTYTKAGDGTASTASLTTDICSVDSAGLVSYSTAGTCTLQASVTEGRNHNAVTGLRQSFEVGKAAGSITINNLPASADTGTTYTPTFTKAGDGVASVASRSTSCTVSQGVVSFVAAGPCTLVASVTAGTNHQAATGSEQTVEVKVSAFTLKGFFNPIGESNSFVRAPGQLAPTASTSTVWQTAKGGSTIPLKFEIFQNGVESSSTGDIKSFQATKLSTCSGTTTDGIEELASAGSSSLRYDTTDGQFIQNWKTSAVSSDTCYRVALTTQDGSAIYTFIKLRK